MNKIKTIPSKVVIIIILWYLMPIIVTTWAQHVPLAFHLGREADHSPPSSAEVKEWVELYLHSRNTPSWRGAQLGGGGAYNLIFIFEDY
jgi:hypothetical protein